MKLPIDVFTEWAKDGRDERMARGHADSVNSMLDFALEDQVGLIKHVTDNWLNPGGRLIMGIDYYTENKVSESWSEDCGISIMTRLSEAEWKCA